MWAQRVSAVKRGQSRRVIASPDCSVLLEREQQLRGNVGGCGLGELKACIHGRCPFESSELDRVRTTGCGCFHGAGAPMGALGPPQPGWLSLGYGLACRLQGVHWSQ